MMKSLRQKYLVMGFLMILGFLCMNLLFSWLLQGKLVENWNKKDMEIIAETVIDELSQSQWEIEKDEIDNLAFENNLSITIVDESYNILAATRMREVTRGELGKKVTGILESHDFEDKNNRVFYSDFDDGMNKAIFIQINKEPGKGYVIIRKSVLGLKGSLHIMQVCFVVSAFLTLVCGIVLLICFSDKMTKPIREISRVTGQIAKMNFDEKVQVRSQDELGELANSVNVMSDSLKDAMETLKNDVERRKMLVRNIAHELKTPVAVVMGYAENMPYVARENQDKLEKYCKIISEECVRMDKMICQMLEFSSYETGGDTLRKRSFTAGEFIQNIQTCFENEFPDRKDSLKILDRTNGKIFADYDAVQRSVYNFLKNAVAYGKEYGKIRLGVWETQKYFYFSVFNQGEPISKENIEKIWDVFFKVNAARTREKQSFGIGLSIVKQAALAHGGDVRAVNIGNGVEFIFSIKK